MGSGRLREAHAVAPGLLRAVERAVGALDDRLGIVVGASLWMTLIVGTMAGSVIPLVLHVLKVDPTAASGPLITTLNDIFSITIYFTIASFFLNQLLS